MIIFGETFIVNQVIAAAIILSSFLQIYSAVSQSGDNFTKEVGRAFFDLTHTISLIITLAVICIFGNFLPEYVVGVGIGLAFTMARSVSYILVCSTADMTFKQF